MGSTVTQRIGRVRLSGARRGDLAHSACFEIFDCFEDLGLRVHDEGTVASYGFPYWFACHQEYLCH